MWRGWGGGWCRWATREGWSRRQTTGGPPLFLHPILQSPYPLVFKLLLPLIPALFRVVPGGRSGLTSHLNGFSPECCRECTLRDMLRLKDFPQVSQVKGMSLVWATGQAPWP